MKNLQIITKNKLSDGHTFKVSQFKERIMKTQPHKHDEYHEMIFLSDGDGFHTIEDQNFIVTAPDFYFLKPGQLHYWQFTSIPRGFVVLFSIEEFDNVKEHHLIEMLRKLSENQRIMLIGENAYFILLNEMLDEYRKNTIYSKEIIHSFLAAIAGKLLQHVSANLSEQQPVPSVLDRFQTLLLKECPGLRKVNQYADLLNMTPQNLNTLCRRHNGKNASELIVSRIMLEAKRYILHTDFTIKEIADMLKFSDTSNFVKFFRKNEGITPLQFREHYFQ